MITTASAFELRNVTLGRITGVGILKVDMQLRWVDRPAMTIEHWQVDGHWQFSASGTMWKRVDSDDCFEGGQIIGRARQLKTPAALRLARLWDRWHLNDMRAGCAHQTPVGDDTSSQLANTPPCPQTGYRWGSAWLTEEIPADQLTAIVALADELAPGRL
jgi:hypothetical protein